VKAVPPTGVGLKDDWRRSRDEGDLGVRDIKQGNVERGVQGLYGIVTLAGKKFVLENGSLKAF